MSTMNKPRAPRRVVRWLADALKAARMGENASFNKFSDDFVVLDKGSNQVDVDGFVKDRIDLYMKTWVIPQIEAALTWAMGEGHE